MKAAQQDGVLLEVWGIAAKRHLVHVLSTYLVLTVVLALHCPHAIGAGVAPMMCSAQAAGIVLTAFLCSAIHIALLLISPFSCHYASLLRCRRFISQVPFFSWSTFTTT